MVDSQPEGEGAQRVELENTGENIDVLRTMIKEHDQQDKAKATPKKLVYDESEEENSDISGVKGLENPKKLVQKSDVIPSEKIREAGESKQDQSKIHRRKNQEDLNTPYKRPKPTPFTTRTTRFKYHEKAKLPRNVKVYEGSKDLEDHLDIFSATTEQEEWPMPVWCKMFHQTLSGATRNWFDDLGPKSVDNFEELSQKFLEEFSQQKRYAKDPTKIHSIKRRMNEGLQEFIEWFKSESSHIKGVPSVLRISAFTHRYGHPELTKKLNDKIPKTVDGMFERVRAFIRRDAATRSAEVARAPQWDKGTTRPGWRDTFTPLTKTLKEILAMESVNFSLPLPLKQIIEAVASGKLAHLLKDIRRGNQRNESQGRGGMKVINMVGSRGIRKRPYEMENPGLMEEIAFLTIPRNNLTDAPIILEGKIEGYHVRRIYIDGGSSSEIMYEHCFKNFDADIKSRLRKSNAPLVERFSGEIYHPLGLIDLRVTMGELGRSKTMLLEFAIVKCRSPYNVIMGRTGMKSLGTVGSTIHSMIKCPTTRGVATIETNKEALWECRQIEEMKSTWKETQWRQHMEQMYRIRKQGILRARGSKRNL
ncbi:reverse transcriptase domain-containing protein [Tanacetum coccineum]